MYFAFDDSSIQQSERDRLDGNSACLEKVPAKKVTVAGHTDSSGGDAINQPLSERRALAVADALISSGVQRERLFVAGQSSRVPVASNATAEGRAQNRRVEILIRPFTG